MDSEQTVAEHLLDLLNKESADSVRRTGQNVAALMACYKCAMYEVETKFRVLNEQFSFRHERNPIDSIKTRLKSPESILQKLQARNLPISIASVEEHLNDIAGIRVICPFVDDIYLLANCLIQQDDITLIERKDYIENPKPNGYRSLHLIVGIPIFLQDEKKEMKVEVQLRTIAMDSWANLEHRLRYKKHLDADTERRTADELAACAHMSAELDRRMQDIRHAIER